MKLQVNDKGGWRHVMDFPADRARDVEAAAAALAKGVDGVKVRVIDDDGTARWLNDQGEFRPLRDSAEVRHDA